MNHHIKKDVPPIKDEMGKIEIDIAIPAGEFEEALKEYNESFNCQIEVASVDGHEPGGPPCYYVAITETCMNLVFYLMSPYGYGNTDGTTTFADVYESWPELFNNNVDHHPV